MGFFGGGSKTSTMTHDNPLLGKYTESYRNTAPWEFASLDPTATLAAMNAGAIPQTSAEFKTSLQQMSTDEQKQATAARDAMARVQERQKSGKFLTPQETEFINTNLDKAFEYAHTVGYADWEKGQQSLAGRQGLRTSDTPVAAPAMRELRNFELGLGSQRAQMGLQATLQTAAQQNAFDASFAQFYQNLELQRTNMRQGYLFGGGLQGAAGIHSTDTSKQTQKMSGFGQFMSGLQMATGVLELGKNVGGMMAAGGMMGGGAPAGAGGGSGLSSGGGSNAWMTNQGWG